MCPSISTVSGNTFTHLFYYLRWNGVWRIDILKDCHKLISPWGLPIVVRSHMKCTFIINLLLIFFNNTELTHYSPCTGGSLNSKLLLTIQSRLIVHGEQFHLHASAHSKTVIFKNLEIHSDSRQEVISCSLFHLKIIIII